MKKIFLFSVLCNLILFGCSKNNNKGNLFGNNYSNWTLVTTNYDSAVYNAHPDNKVNSDAEFEINGNPNTLTCDGFVDSSNFFIKTTTISIQFLNKPTRTRVYKIGDASDLNDSTCFISLTSLSTYYTYVSSTIGESINVTVTGGLVTVSFKSISLTGTDLYNTEQWPANISGNIFQGK